MLIRRVKDACAAPDVQCVGTSATMSTEGSSAEQRRRRSPTSHSSCSGLTVQPDERDRRDPGPRHRSRTPVRSPLPAHQRRLPPRPTTRIWSGTRWRPGSRPRFGLDRRRGQPSGAGRSPRTAANGRGRLAEQTGSGRRSARRRCKQTLQAGSRARHPQTDRPLFAFRLHQFLSKGDTVYVTLEDEATRHITRDYQVEQPGLGREGPAAAGVLPGVRPGVPGGLAADRRPG